MQQAAWAGGVKRLSKAVVSDVFSDSAMIKLMKVLLRDLAKRHNLIG
jgi:hypothetical protein